MGTTPGIPPFAALVAHSSHSHLFGAVGIEALVSAAAALGYKHLALTDRNNLGGIPRFLQLAEEAGLHPIVGVEVTDDESAVVALARDAIGYANLCRLVSRRQLALGRPPPSIGAFASLYEDENDDDMDTFCTDLPPRERPEHERGFRLADLLPELAAGLFLLVEDPALAEELAPHLPAGCLHLRLVRPGRRETHERAVLTAARRLQLSVVATGEPAFLVEGGVHIHRLLAAIERGSTYAEIDAGDPTLRVAASRLASPDEMARRFADIPDAVGRSLTLAESCNVPLAPRGRVLPRLTGSSTVSAGADGLNLRALCREGVRWRYGFVEPQNVTARLAHELELIIRLGFAGYFLVVHDIVMHSRRIGAPVAGRGSGGSSLVAYLLGITNVDPLRFGIAFERFLNEGRADAPDLDIDFCWRVRDRVIAYVYERFGRDRVAMVCTHITFQARGAFREAARAFGLADLDITALRRELPARFDDLLAGMKHTWSFRSGGRAKIMRERSAEPAEALALAEQVTRVPPELFRRITRAAACILGFPRHFSVHPGGVVITPEPICGYAPLGIAAKGVVVTQYEKDGVEDMGLVKIDLLGNRALSTTREAVEITGSCARVRLDVEHLPDGDPETVALLQRADTIGCNQLESPAMRHLLAQASPRSMRDVMQCLALIRPGAASLGGKDEFLKRARGLAAPLFADERLRAVLGDSYGILLYEDDSMLVAQALAGCTGVEADRLRKGITKAKDDATRLELSQRFLAGCDRQGVARAAAEHVWVQMAKFNAYSFCKAHAASYATIAYAVAYLKAHHPLSFWVAALNNNQGLYPKRVYIEEAKRRGLRILPPTVQHSGREFERQRAEPAPSLCEGIRIGLGQIRGLSERAQEEIVGARPFAGLADLLRRTSLSQPEAESLIACGACDGFGLSRPRLLLELHLELPGLRRERGREQLFVAGAGLPGEGGRGLPGQADWSAGEKQYQEQSLLGLSFREHPLAALRPSLPAAVRARAIKSTELRRHEGRQVRLIGILDTCRHVETDAGDDMQFLTFEDEWGIFEVSLFPDAYRAFSGRVRGWGPYLIRGRADDHLGALTVTCENLQQITSLGSGDAVALG